MKRALAILGLVAISVALWGGSAVAATVAATNQLRGHLPELGERPTTRVFVTQAAYDSYRNSLGDANVFPPASSLFMTFEKDILALYTRGNDTGGRCIATAVTASSSADTVTANLQWQPGTCGAPSTAHYPFILFSLSRTAADGTIWVRATRQVCAVVDSPSTNACANLSGASPVPSATPSSAPTATATLSGTPTATATRSLTPSQTIAAASPTPAATSAPASASRSPAAAASPPPAAADGGTNLLLYAMLIAIGFLVLLSLFLSRGGPRR
jgi:hypothetical protein